MKKNAVTALRQAVGKNIASLRKRKKLTQAGFAKEVGVLQVTVHNWESAATLPSVAHVVHMREVFGVNLSKIIPVNY